MQYTMLIKKSMNIMYIGPYQLSNNLIVAPMAGVTDRPFRSLCKYFGAGHAVSEMMTADKTLRMTKKKFISC